MASIRNIALAFADGFAPIDALLGGIERPGSRDNLISNSPYPSIEALALSHKSIGVKLTSQPVTGVASDLRKQGIRALVSSLRAKATEIENSATLQENEHAGTTHGS